MSKLREMWNHVLYGPETKQAQDEFEAQIAAKIKAAEEAIMPSNGIWNQQAQLQNANQGMGQVAQNQSALGGQVFGWGGTTYPNSITDQFQQQMVKMQDDLTRTRWELASQQDIRKQDAALLKRFFRMEQWLKEAHPEVMDEFKAVNDLLRTAGEEEI